MGPRQLVTKLPCLLAFYLSSTLAATTTTEVCDSSGKVSQGAFYATVGVSTALVIILLLANGGIFVIMRKKLAGLDSQTEALNREKQMLTTQIVEMKTYYCSQMVPIPAAP